MQGMMDGRKEGGWMDTTAGGGVDEIHVHGNEMKAIEWS